MANIDFTKYTAHELEIIFNGAVTLAAPHVDPYGDIDCSKCNKFFIEKAAKLYNTIQARAKKA